MARSRTLIVAGAGICGLSAAIALERVGYRVIVLERAAKLEDIGAGIQLSPNATHALDALGVLEALRLHAIEPRMLVVCDGARGEELARIDLMGAGKRFGAPFLLVARADLQRALAASAADNMDITIEQGTELLDFADHTRGVTVSAKKGGESSEQFGAALIGADGLRSRVRAQLAAHCRNSTGSSPGERSFPPGPAALYAEPVVRLWLGRARISCIIRSRMADGQPRRDLHRRLAGRGRKRGRYQKKSARLRQLDRDAAISDRGGEKFRRFTRNTTGRRSTLGQGPRDTARRRIASMLPFSRKAQRRDRDALALARRMQDAEEVAPALRAETERARAARRIRGRAPRADYHRRHSRLAAIFPAAHQGAGLIGVKPGFTGTANRRQRC